MTRAFVLLLLVWLMAMAAIWLRPDPRDPAERKAAADAAQLADLAGRPDRLGMRLSEDPAMRTAVLWDENGQVIFPADAAFTLLRHRLSEESLRRIDAVRGNAGWTAFDPSGSILIRCAGPDVCVLYDRDALETAYGVKTGALTRPDRRGALTAALGLGVLVILLALVRHYRRTGPPRPGFEVLPDHLKARRGALEVPLTLREVKLLTHLMAKDGAVVSKDELYDVAWGRDFMPNSRALDQQVINLRRKLDPDRSRPALIETVRGVGYRYCG